MFLISGAKLRKICKLKRLRSYSFAEAAQESPAVAAQGVIYRHAGRHRARWLIVFPASRFPAAGRPRAPKRGAGPAPWHRRARHGRRRGFPQGWDYHSGWAFRPPSGARWQRSSQVAPQRYSKRAGRAAGPPVRAAVVRRRLFFATGGAAWAGQTTPRRPCSSGVARWHSLFPPAPPLRGRLHRW